MTATGDERTVRIEHHIAAPPHTVYRAWLEPDLVQRWMAPGDQEVTRVEIDERPGGHWRTWKAGDGVIVGGFDSEPLELVPGQRLVFRWGFIGPQRRQGPSFDMLLAISLRADPPGTMLTLVHEAWPSWRPRCQTSAPTSAPAGKLCWRTLGKTLAVGG